MASTEAAVTIDADLLNELDRLIAARVFSDRSQAIQAVLRDKLTQLNRNRLAAECARLDPVQEQQFAEVALRGSRRQSGIYRTVCARGTRVGPPQPPEFRRHLRFQTSRWWPLQLGKSAGLMPQ